MKTFTIDGSTLTVNAADGSVFFELVSVDESRVTRWVMQPEELAPLLRDALIPTAQEAANRLVRPLDDAFDTYCALKAYVHRTESLAAQDA